MIDEISVNNLTRSKLKTTKHLCYFYKEICNFFVKNKY